MAVSKIYEDEMGLAIYQGLSTDTKPTAVKALTKFIETDTGILFEYKGAGAGWDLAGDQGAGATGTLASTDVDGSLTVVDAAIDVTSYNKLFVDVLPGAAAFTAFQILVSADGTTFNTIKSTSADYNFPDGYVLISTSADLTTLGAATHGWFLMDVSGFKEVQIKAQSSGTSNTTAAWSAN